MSWLNRLLPNRPGAKSLDPAVRETLARWASLPPADLSRTHSETRYVVLNTHAAGLDIDADRLLSVAGIAIDSCRIGLTESYHAELGDAPERILADLLAFAGKGPVVVYNAAFNRVHLERAFEQHLGVEPDWVWLDLYWLLPALFGERISEPTKLARWMQVLDADTFQRFHALGDAYALARLMLAAESRALKRGLASPRSLADLERARRQIERR